MNFESQRTLPPPQPSPRRGREPEFVWPRDFVTITTYSLQPSMGVSTLASAAASRLIDSADMGDRSRVCNRVASQIVARVEMAAIQPTVPKCWILPSVDSLTMSPPRYAPPTARDVLNGGVRAEESTAAHRARRCR